MSRLLRKKEKKRLVHQIQTLCHSFGCVGRLFCVTLSELAQKCCSLLSSRCSTPSGSCVVIVQDLPAAAARRHCCGGGPEPQDDRKVETLMTSAASRITAVELSNVSVYFIENRGGALGFVISHSKPRAAGGPQ